MFLLGVGRQEGSSYLTGFPVAGVDFVFQDHVSVQDVPRWLPERTGQNILSDFKIQFNKSYDFEGKRIY